MEEAMRLSESMLPEFDQEMAGTRKTLERVPEDKLDWQPHEKSWTMITLATHLANMLNWAATTLKTEELDFAPPGEEPYREPVAKSRAELLAKFDAGVAETRAALAAASDEQMLAPWTLLNGGKVFFTMPRIAVLRSFVMNHMIHHRAQLTMYLRLNDVSVPALYGPSADEGGM
jgi:uncharacterized damage-inducible protein DinB